MRHVDPRSWPWKELPRTRLSREEGTMLQVKYPFAKHSQIQQLKITLKDSRIFTFRVQSPGRAEETALVLARNILALHETSGVVQTQLGQEPSRFSKARHRSRKESWFLKRATIVIKKSSLQTKPGCFTNMFFDPRPRAMVRSVFLCLACVLGASQELWLGVYGPFTSYSQVHMAVAVSVDLDLRKNFEPQKVLRFGLPVIPIPNLHPQAVKPCDRRHVP